MSKFRDNEYPQSDSQSLVTIAHNRVFTVAEPLNALTGWSAKQCGPSRGTALLVILIRLCRQKRFKS